MSSERLRSELLNPLNSKLCGYFCCCCFSGIRYAETFDFSIFYSDVWPVFRESQLCLSLALVLFNLPSIWLLAVLVTSG